MGLAGVFQDSLEGFLQWRCPEAQLEPAACVDPDSQLWHQSGCISLIVPRTRARATPVAVQDFYGVAKPITTPDLELIIYFRAAHVEIQATVHDDDFYNPVDQVYLDYCDPDLYEQLERIIAGYYTAVRPSIIMLPAEAPTMIVQLPTPPAPAGFEKSDFLWLPQGVHRYFCRSEYI